MGHHISLTCQSPSRHSPYPHACQEVSSSHKGQSPQVLELCLSLLPTLPRLAESPRIPENTWIMFTAGWRQLISLRFVLRYSLNSFSRFWSSSRTSTNMVQAHRGSRPLEPPTLRSSDMHPILVLNCCRVFEFQVLCIFALILRSMTVHCHIPYYSHLRAHPVSVNTSSDQVDGQWTIESSPSYARTNVQPYPYYGTVCTPISSGFNYKSWDEAARAQEHYLHLLVDSYMSYVVVVVLE